MRPEDQVCAEGVVGRRSEKQNARRLSAPGAIFPLQFRRLPEFRWIVKQKFFLGVSVGHLAFCLNCPGFIASTNNGQQAADADAPSPRERRLLGTKSRSEGLEQN